MPITIEGIFAGDHMVGEDLKIYPVGANYASKSKLIEGDKLKLSIEDDGSFIYKQFGPAENRRTTGKLTSIDNGRRYQAVTEDGKVYNVLSASITYFKAREGDTLAIIVPVSKDATWAAVENIIRAPFDEVEF